VRNARLVRVERHRVENVLRHRLLHVQLAPLSLAFLLMKRIN
jgi:hypothetical protein